MNEAFSESSAVVKENKLKSYAQREPKRFCQIDLDVEDNITGGEGPSLLSSATIELIHVSDVRVLIRPDLDPKMAVKLLRWAASDVEQEPGQLDTWRGISELKPIPGGETTEKPEANDGEKQAMSRHLISIEQCPGDLPRPILEIVRNSVFEGPPVMRAALAAVDQWRNEKRADEVGGIDSEIPF